MDNLVPGIDNDNTRCRIFTKNGQDVVGQRIVVHRFTLSDTIDDPIVYAAEQLIHWEKSQAGAWVMEHALEKPDWLQNHDMVSWGWSYCIRAWLTAEHITFYKLKFS